MFKLERECAKEMMAEAREKLAEAGQRKFFAGVWVPFVGFAAFGIMLLIRIVIGAGEAVFPD